ncbi:hypothetical protein HK102_004847, partial [Quaeritorhiza haematococci]
MRQGGEAERQFPQRAQRDSSIGPGRPVHAARKIATRVGSAKAATSPTTYQADTADRPCRAPERPSRQERAVARKWRSAVADHAKALVSDQYGETSGWAIASSAVATANPAMASVTAPSLGPLKSREGMGRKLLPTASQAGGHVIRVVQQEPGTEPRRGCRDHSPVVLVGSERIGLHDDEPLGGGRTGSLRAHRPGRRSIGRDDAQPALEGPTGRAPQQVAERRSGLLDDPRQRVEDAIPAGDGRTRSGGDDLRFEDQLDLGPLPDPVLGEAGGHADRPFAGRLRPRPGVR